MGDPYTGLAFIVPEAWNKMTDPTAAEIWINNGVCAGVDYIPEEYIRKVDQVADTATDAEWDALLDEISQNSGKVLRIYRVNKGIEISLEIEKEIKDAFEHIQPMGMIGEDQNYIAYNNRFDEAKLSENDKANLAKLVQGVEAIQDGLMLFPAQPYTEPLDLKTNLGKRAYRNFYSFTLCAVLP